MSPEQLDALRKRHSNVPCGACNACCKSDRIILGPTDSRENYRWHQEGSQDVLDRKENGECVYLTEAGCGIHDNAPDICKRFDCRVLVQITPAWRQGVRITQNPNLFFVYKAGQQRLHTLKAPMGPNGQVSNDPESSSF